MIYTTKELLNSGETKYSIKKKLISKELKLIERGMYSSGDDVFIDEFFLLKKYPKAILTGISAFSFYNLTDAIPDNVCLSTEQHSFPLRNKLVEQSYQDSKFFSIGASLVEYDGGMIRIYDLERMLIELIRLRSKYSPELYFEVLNSFRKLKDKLDINKLMSYLNYFPNGDSIIHKIREVL